MNIIRGTTENDTLTGLPDTTGGNIYGNAGDDSITGGDRSRDYSIFGNTGDDTLTLGHQGANVTVYGGTGRDLITGGEDSEAILLLGQRGEDILAINTARNATLDGGSGNDTVFGGAGDDHIIWGAGSDDIDGGLGTDTLTVNFDRAGDDVGGRASFYVTIDEWRGSERFVTLNLTTGRDLGTTVATATVSDVDVFEFSGETLSFEDLEAFVAVAGTAGNDVLIAETTGRNIDALGGDDWVTLGTSNATIDGGAGTDMISFADVPEDSRLVVFNANSFQIAPLAGVPDSASLPKLFISDFEGITGTSNSDAFSAGNEFSTLRGLGGRDVFILGQNDIAVHADGGASIDRVTYSGTRNDISVSLLRGTGWDGDARGDTYVSIEHVTGGFANDTITGDHGDNTFDGLVGDDVFIGNGGDDSIFGAGGNDIAIFSYDRDQYEIVLSPSTDRISDTENRAVVTYIGAGAGDGQDTLDGVEILQFADGDVFL